ncbi:MAG: hypothetical protein KC776_20080 [Myxococcales bacterium]|nr:hypothetical protein [Myxococcales bacterium]MCB9580836.1 hypothetical protein [Polyangiaceae bacterium]
MAAPLAFKKRVKLPELSFEQPLRRRRSKAPLGVAAWIAGVALCWGLTTGRVSLSWLDAATTTAHAAVTEARGAPVAAVATAKAPEPAATVREVSAVPPPVATVVAEPTISVESDDPGIDVPSLGAPSADEEEPEQTATGIAPDQPPAEEAHVEAKPPPPPPPKPEPEPAPQKVIAAVAGMSCEQAMAQNDDEITVGGARGPADLPASAFGAVLDKGGYLNYCGVPGNMTVRICAAVKNGKAIGVTVHTVPGNHDSALCVARAVRRLGFPSSPRLDVVRTTFEAE